MELTLRKPLALTLVWWLLDFWKISGHQGI